RVAARGRFYSEDDLADYDVVDYDIEAALAPERQWLDGRARLLLKVRSYMLGTLTLKLADSLAGPAIISRGYGRLFGIRVKNQNSVVINLPTTIPRDTLFSVTISYAGRLESQSADRETIGVEQGRPQSEDFPMLMTPEANTLYSSRSFWYPQA